MTIRAPHLLPVAALVLLAACSPPQPPPSQVASLSTADSAAPATSASAAADAERPQLRLDSTEEDVRRAWAPYNVCLKQNGHKMIAGRGDGNSPDQRDESATAKAARTACAGKLPQQPPELDQRNPEFLDNFREWIKCMDGKGLKVTPVEPFGSGWNYAEGSRDLSAEQRHKIEKDCKIEAFSAQ